MRASLRPTPDRFVLLGLLLAAAAYCRDLRYDFLLDDVPLILMNDTFAKWGNWPKLFVGHVSSSPTAAMLFPGSPAVHYRPVYMLWLMVISRVSGVSSPWLHLSSLLLHLLATFLLYRLGLRIIREAWTAALAAVIFAFHPIHLESVAYISASADLLVAVFTMLAVLSYLQFREDHGSAAYWVLSIVSASLAMLSKETGAMVPWILVAYEALRGNATGDSPLWKRSVRILPYFGVVATYGAARHFLFGSARWPASAESNVAALLSIPLVFLAYLRNLIWPFHLGFFYPIEWTSRWTIFRAVFILLILGAAIWLWRRSPGTQSLRLQLVWTAVLFVPPLAGVFLFARDDWVHDRHIYLPSAAICMLAVTIFRASGLPHRATLLVGVAVPAVLLTTTFLNVSRFSDELSVYESALKVAPNSLTLHRFYAWALLSYGQTPRALLEFQRTTQMSPYSANAHEEYATALSQSGYNDQAAVELSKALQFAAEPTPFRAFALYRLASIQLAQGDTADATANLREAIQIDPHRLNYHATLAQALRQQGFNEEADQERQREAAVRAEPSP